MSAVVIVASFPAAPFYARVVGRLRAIAGCRQGAPDDEFAAFVARAWFLPMARTHLLLIAPAVRHS